MRSVAMACLLVLPACGGAQGYAAFLNFDGSADDAGADDGENDGGGDDAGGGSSGGGGAGCVASSCKACVLGTASCSGAGVCQCCVGHVCL